MGNFGCTITLFLYAYSFKIQAKSFQSGQDGVVPKTPYNIFLTDNDDLKVDLDINEDDYEMIVRNKALEIMNEDQIFQEFNRIASTEYEKTMDRNRERLEKTESSIFMHKTDNLTSPLVTSHYMSQTSRNVTNENVEYDYLVSEYYAAKTGNATTNTYDPFEIGQSEYGFLDSLKIITSFNTSYNCTEQEFKGIGIGAIKCLVEEFYTKQQDYKTLAKHLWKIVAIWIVVYLVIAVPLWFTRGWCSCCLCCKFFKPQQTIQEAKNYQFLNPPGIWVTKRGDIIQYEPTEREKDCYEEFGHFLRTL